MVDQNPKMADCNIIDCIPQIGKCPLDCLECYYNREGAFYRTLNIPLLPTLEEAKGKIVRVNSGHDSNLEKEKVIKVTKDYTDKFYNTSLPVLKFNAPIVLTINSRDTDETFYWKEDINGNISDLMFVRFRTNTWNIPLALLAIDNWSSKVPIMVTDMRYYHKELVKEPQYYQYGKHILNEYWKLNSLGIKRIFESLLKYPNVFWCGNPFSLSTMCKECRLCEQFYIKTKIRLGL